MTLAWGTSSGQQFEPLGSQFAHLDADPRSGCLPAERDRRPAHPRPSGPLPTMKTIGVIEVAFFAARAELGPPLAAIHIDLAADEIGSECRQPITQWSLGPAVFDHQILSLDIAGIAQSLAESSYQQGSLAGRPAAEETDHRHRRLLRARGKRPCDCGAGGRLKQTHAASYQASRSWRGMGNMAQQSPFGYVAHSWFRDPCATGKWSPAAARLSGFARCNP